jgi:hypothetical protein
VSAVLSHLNDEDDEGLGWSTLSEARDPSRIRPHLRGRRWLLRVQGRTLQWRSGLRRGSPESVDTLIWLIVPVLASWLSLLLSGAWTHWARVPLSQAEEIS